MSDAPSFLLPAEQESLPGLPAPAFFAEMEAKGEFTGERLFLQRPDTYKALVVLLGQGLGVIRIGKLLGVSPNTVMAVRKREGATIEHVKEHLAEVAHAGATLASESLLLALNEIAQRAHLLGVKDLKDLAVTYGILVQNGQLLAGQPTARVEITDLRKPEHDDFNRYIQGLANATDLTAEKSAQKETAQPDGSPESAPIAGPGATGPVIDVPASPADGPSIVSTPQPADPQDTP